MIFTLDPFDSSVSPGGVRAVGRGNVDTRKGQPVATYRPTRPRQGIVEVRNHLARSALDAVRDCREQMRQGETAMWLNASYAYRHGASREDIATVTGMHIDTVSRKLKQVDPRTFR